MAHELILIVEALGLTIPQSLLLRTEEEELISPS